MEVIKCPVCGNEKCKEITEDKYICLACDNVFLIHNLSKEFKQTDEHIDRVYTDLKDTIINNMASADGLDSAYRSAISLVERGDYRDAQEIFDDISKKYAWSYKGWYGQFLVAKGQNNKFNSNIYSLIVKVIDSEDVTSEIRQIIDDYLIETKKNYSSYIADLISNCEIEQEKREVICESLRNSGLENELHNDLKKANVKKKAFKVIRIVLIIVCILLAIYAVGLWVINSEGIWIVLKPIILIALAIGLYKLWDECDIVSFAIVSIITEISILLPDFEIEEERIEKKLNDYYGQIKQAEKDIQKSQERKNKLENIKNVCGKVNVSNIETYKELAEELKVCKIEEDDKEISKSNRVKVELEEFGGDKVKVIKAIYEIMHLDLGEAKRMVDNVPSIIAQDINLEKAQEIKCALEDRGCTVRIL